MAKTTKSTLQTPELETILFGGRPQFAPVGSERPSAHLPKERTQLPPNVTTYVTYGACDAPIF